MTTIAPLLLGAVALALSAPSALAGEAAPYDEPPFEGPRDSAPQATGFGGGSAGFHHGKGIAGLGDHGHGHGKFFMYAHQPAHKTYEFGFKRGNDKHVVERYEKGGPHHDFKSKFRWHDKHGGHGERYWDYNHGDDHKHKDHDGHHSEPAPEYFMEAEETQGTPHLTSQLTPQLTPQLMPQHTHEHNPQHNLQHNHQHDPQQNHKQASLRAFQRHRRRSPYYQKKPKGAHAKKPTGMGKKPFGGPKEKEGTFKESPKKEEIRGSPAASGSDWQGVLGAFNPFRPRSNASNSRPRYNSKRKPRNQEKKNTSDNSSPLANGVIPKLSYDPSTKRVYDENTGKWYRLVPA